MKKLNKKQILGIFFGFIIISIIFILMTFLSRTFENDIRQLLEENNYTSKILYVIITAIAVVLAPISALPLIPLVSNIWGGIITAILSIIGWVVGSQIAFLLARKYGKPFVEKLFPIEKINSFENYFTSKNLFWTIVFLRIMLPVDILSYALGLFSKIKSNTFFFATLIGVAPFGFIFSYAGNISTRTQITMLLESLGIMGLIWIIYNITQRKKRSKN